MRQAYIIENFLSDSECNFLINYYHKHNLGYSWEETEYIRWIDSPFYHFRFNLIKKKYIKKITKIFPNLKISFGQIVRWKENSYKEKHIDVEHDEKTKCTWASVCYLNDDFCGGSTIIEEENIKPTKGSLLLFCGSEIPHGVEKVIGNSRYTCIVWWKND